MKKASDFELPDQDGNIKRLEDYKGKWVVLYFYPKDDTPGCSLEACNFRDERESIAQLGNAEVIGISKDSVKKHKAFANRFNLTFTLLSDEVGKTIEKYGAWKQKSMFGKTYMGIQRMTVIINPEGYIVKEYPKVNPRNHALEIIKDLKIIQT
jgi:peroxiredoxin Q/BCP